MNWAITVCFLVAVTRPHELGNYVVFSCHHANRSRQPLGCLLLSLGIPDKRVFLHDKSGSEIAETIRGYLLVGGRDTMETAGISIFEVSKSSRTDSRDSSGTAPSTTYVLEVSAAADWEIHVPLVTRISQFSIDTSSEKAAIDFPGKLQAAPRLTAFGASQFLPYYS